MFDRPRLIYAFSVGTIITIISLLGLALAGGKSSISLLLVLLFILLMFGSGFISALLFWPRKHRSLKVMMKAGGLTCLSMLVILSIPMGFILGNVFSSGVERDVGDIIHWSINFIIYAPIMTAGIPIGAILLISWFFVEKTGYPA